MEVIQNATETVSPLTYLRGRKETLLEELDQETAKTQKIIRTQNSKRQEVMIFCVLGAFCALCSYLVVLAKNSFLKDIYVPVAIIMIVMALIFLACAIKNYPASVKYRGSWSNYKKAKPYEDVLKESLAKRKKTKEAIERLNSQLKRMDEGLTMTDIPDEQ